MARSTAKQLIKRRLPFLISAVHFVRRLPWRTGTMEQRFQKMVNLYVRQGLESLSGPGSTLAETRVIRTEIPRLVVDLNVKVLLDIPCGDFHWMKDVNLEVDRYIGADVLEKLIAANKEKFEREDRSFIQLDLTKGTLPAADLILCRDCLVHLSFADIFLALDNIKSSGAKYLLTTTFGSVEENLDIYSGEWRRLNLEKAPFNLPPPIRLINEQCTIARYADKSLGLWRIGDLPAGQRTSHRSARA